MTIVSYISANSTFPRFGSKFSLTANLKEASTNRKGEPITFTLPSGETIGVQLLDNRHTALPKETLEGLSEFVDGENEYFIDSGAMFYVNDSHGHDESAFAEQLDPHGQHVFEPVKDLHKSGNPSYVVSGIDTLLQLLPRFRNHFDRRSRALRDENTAQMNHFNAAVDNHFKQPNSLFSPGWDTAFKWPVWRRNR